MNANTVLRAYRTPRWMGTTTVLVYAWRLSIVAAFAVAVIVLGLLIH